MNVEEFAVFNTNETVNGYGAFLIVTSVVICGRPNLITPGRVNDNSRRLDNGRVRIGPVFRDVVS